MILGLARLQLKNIVITRTPSNGSVRYRIRESTLPVVSCKLHTKDDLSRQVYYPQTNVTRPVPHNSRIRSDEIQFITRV